MRPAVILDLSSDYRGFRRVLRPEPILDCFLTSSGFKREGIFSSSFFVALNRMALSSCEVFS